MAIICNIEKDRWSGRKCIYGCSDGGEDRDRKEGSEIPGGGENGDHLAFCMKMTWFCVMSRRRTRGGGKVC